MNVRSSCTASLRDDLKGRSITFHPRVTCTHGFSLLEVTMAIGIASVLMLAMAYQFNYEARQNRALTEKLAANDLSRVISGILSSPSTCSLLMTKPGNVAEGDSLTFNYEAAHWPVTINLNSIPLSSDESVVSTTQPYPSPLSNTLRIKAQRGLQLQVSSPSTANLLVHFEQTPLAHPFMI